MYLHELQYHALEKCDFDANFVTEYLIPTRFLGILYGVFFLGLALFMHELYFFFVSIASFVNVLLNFLLVVLIRDPVPNGRCGSTFFFCNDPLRPDTVCDTMSTPWASEEDMLKVHCVPCGAPSLEVQTTATLVIFLYGFFFQFNPVRYKPIYSVAVQLWYAVVVYAHVFFGFSSPLHAILGAAVGAVYGAVASSLIYFFIVPNFGPITQHWLAIKFGPYHDTYTTLTTDRMTQLKADQQKRDTDTLLQKATARLGLAFSLRKKR